MAFPDTISTSAAQALAKLGNNALAAGQTNTVQLDQLQFVQEVVGNMLTSLPPTLGVSGLPASKYTLNAASGATTAAAGDMTGAQYVIAGYSAVGAAALTTRTAAQLFADVPNAKVGDSYTLLIVNTSGGTTTLTAGVGVTITGTATLATNTTRTFNVKFVSATAVTFQSVSIGTIA